MGLPRAVGQRRPDLLEVRRGCRASCRPTGEHRGGDAGRGAAGTDRIGPGSAHQRPGRRRDGCHARSRRLSPHRGSGDPRPVAYLRRASPRTRASGDRHAAPIRRSRSRACARKGELVEIRAADLRFTPDEAAAYLNELMGLALTAGDIAALEERTEGWIAALQLAALSMQGREDAAGLHRGLRRRRSVRRRLPRRGGPAAPARATCGPSCCAPRSSTGSPARCAMPSPRDRGQRHARGARAGQPVRHPARRPARLVSVPPPVRRRAPRTPGGGAGGLRPGPPSARQRVVRGRTAIPPRPSATPSPARITSAPLA